MILETKQFKLVCSKVLSSIDNNLSGVTDNLELITKNNFLYMNVTNKEYYVSIKFQLNTPEQFKATVNAELFLKLISQITTDTIELKLDQTNINIKGNGKYKIPLIFDNGNLMELPKITLDNMTTCFTIPKDTLTSISNYNSKEMLKDNVTKPIQKMYYIDENGCITFTGTGACINNFNLNTPVKLLLTPKIVKLFKLFKSDNINFQLFYDSLSNGILQTKISLYDEEVKLDAILSCDDTLLNSVPVKAIRSMLDYNYPYSIVLDKNSLSQSLNRLLLFNKSNVNIYNNCYDFTFTPSELRISDCDNSNMEVLGYQNGSYMNQEDCYTTYLNINEFKTILDGCSDQYITILFGNNKSIIMVRNNIKNILMEYSKD